MRFVIDPPTGGGRALGLGLCYGEAAELTVREHDGLELDLGRGRVAILARKHVHLALVHAKLADVGLRRGTGSQSFMGGGAKRGRGAEVERGALR